MQNLEIGKYRHFKGGEYQVLFIGKNSETLEDVVIYKALYCDGQIWVRPINMFFDFKKLEDGSEVKRFVKID
jgi:hypothetical protein